MCMFCSSKVYWVILNQLCILTVHSWFISHVLYCVSEIQNSQMKPYYYRWKFSFYCLSNIVEGKFKTGIPRGAWRGAVKKGQRGIVFHSQGFQNKLGSNATHWLLQAFARGTFCIKFVN